MAASIIASEATLIARYFGRPQIMTALSAAASSALRGTPSAVSSESRTGDASAARTSSTAAITASAVQAAPGSAASQQNVRFMSMFARTESVDLVTAAAVAKYF